jgi:hypothetical protein
VWEALWQLVQLYGWHKVDEALRAMVQGGSDVAQPEPGTSRVRVELVSGVPDADFELLDRDNDVYAWDEPPIGDEMILPRRLSRRKR